MEGRSEKCECESGVVGRRTCRDGEFEECVCEDDSGASANADDGSGYNDSGVGNGGGGGENSAEPSDIDSGPTREDAGSGSDAGDARIVKDSEILDAADMDAAGPVDSGFDAGEPDTGALDTGAPDTGAPDTGAPDTGGFDAATDAGQPDAGEDAGESYVYGPCDDQGECSGGLTCEVEGSDEGSYCTTSCSGSNDSCPQRPSGTATRRCSSLTNRCRLNCSSGDCPEGMECYEDEYYSRFTCVWP